MGEDVDGLFGRDAVKHLVWELTDPKKDQPVLVVEGTRGSGKTALLNRLDTLLDQVTPHARLDFESNAQIPPHRILTALVFALPRRTDGLSLRFPRFITGQYVMRLDLDHNDRVRARDEVRRKLDKERIPPNLANILAQVAKEALGYVHFTTPVPIQPLLKLVIPPATNWVVRKVWRRSESLGRFRDWYGHRGQGLRHDANDALVELNTWAHQPEDDEAQQRLNELLCDAFFADLRDGFPAKGRGLRKAVILLDNIDTEAGANFVDTLVNTRQIRIANELAPEPLLVVATSRGDYLAARPRYEKLPLPDNAGRDGPPDSAGQSWYQYVLPDLDFDHVRSMVGARQLRDGNNERLTKVIYELTNGHPASTRLLLNTVAANQELRDYPAALLNARDPAVGTEGDTVLATLVARLLAGVTLGPDERATLVTCAAAHTALDARNAARSRTLFPAARPTSPISSSRCSGRSPPALEPRYCAGCCCTNSPLGRSATSRIGRRCSPNCGADAPERKMRRHRCTTRWEPATWVRSPHGCTSGWKTNTVPRMTGWRRSTESWLRRCVTII